MQETFSRGKNADELGIIKSAKFILMRDLGRANDNSGYLPKGTLFKLSKDDGSLSPCFEVVNNEILHLNNKSCLIRYIPWAWLMYAPFEANKTAKELGLDKSAYFYCDSPGHEYHGMVVTLSEDDSSFCPFFKDVSGNKYYNMVIKWKDLRYATKEEIEECGRKHCIVDKPKQSNVLYGTDTIMQDIIKFAKNMTLSSDEKALRKTGLKDENGAFTETAWELTKQKLMQDNEKSLIEIAKAKEEEDKVCKK